MEVKLGFISGLGPIIGTVKRSDNNEAYMHKVYKIVLNPQGIGIGPIFGPLSSSDISIPLKNCTVLATPTDEVEQHYIELTSGIILARPGEMR